MIVRVGGDGAAVASSGWATTTMPETVELPTLEDLKVQEVKISSAVLKAAPITMELSATDPTRSSCCAAGKRKTRGGV